jgi:hypothetical protein
MYHIYHIYHIYHTAINAIHTYTQMHPPLNTIWPFDRDLQIGIPRTWPCLTQRDVRSRDPVPW